jgi:hypothetical protein
MPGHGGSSAGVPAQRVIVRPSFSRPVWRAGPLKTGDARAVVRRQNPADCPRSCRVPVVESRQRHRPTVSGSLWGIEPVFGPRKNLLPARRTGASAVCTPNAPWKKV